ncbi:MAG TPA: DUF6602 domain-containing protein [Ignavibacteria bacterium]
MKPVLFDYFKKTAKVLEASYDRSAEQNASTNLGKNRESFCNLYLNSVLPPKLKTKSEEIWDSKGEKTGQLDLVIIRDDAPSLEFGSDNTYLAEGVFAVLEIKSNLDRTKLCESAKTLLNVKKLTINIGATISIGKPLTRPLRIVFGYEGATYETITDEIIKNGWQDLFDLVCILNRGVLINRGRLLNWEGPSQFLYVNGGAAAIGFIYYYLTSYGTSFLGRSLNINSYFEPIMNWSE